MNTKYGLVRITLLTATLIVSAINVLAQSSGSITGTVKDANGGLVPDATVTANNQAKAITQTAQTNEQGVFVFAQLPPGSYTITVEKQGFKIAEKTNVALSVGDKINAGDCQLETGDVSATIQ